MSTEKTPLLINENEYNYMRYVHSSGASGSDRQATNVSVPPLGDDELPPPYSPSPQGVPMITCRVCGFMIDITAKRNNYVVACNSCNEATPIKGAPPGKKFVRCPCNCLIICDASSQRVNCPRNNCKSIINITPVQTTNPTNTTPVQATNPTSLPEMGQASCAYCHKLFPFNILLRAQLSPFVRCIHCDKVSSIEKKRSVKYGTINMIIAVLFLIAGVGVTVGTFITADENRGIYFIYIGGFVMFVWFFCRSVYYFRMKTSKIVGSSLEEPM